VGLRLVDLSERSVPAALIGMIFADYGAEVIRVEAPGGDELRQLDASAIWFRGQRSVTSGAGGLDEGQLRRLCESADVVIDTAQAWNASTFRYTAPFPACQVYCLLTATPYSADAIAAGARPAEPVYGELAEARWGFMYIQDTSHGGPGYLAWPHAAFGTAWLGLGGILSSLLRRESTGRGQVVTTSLFDGLATLNTQRWVGGGNPPLEPWPPYSSLNRLGDAVMIIALLECLDGKWVQINSGARGAANKLFAAVGRHDLIDPLYDADPGSAFRTKTEADSFWECLPQAFKQHTADEWVEILRPLDVSAMRVREPGEMLEHEQALAQGIAERHGNSFAFGVGAHFSATPGCAGFTVPAPGQDNSRYRECPSQPLAPSRIAYPVDRAKGPLGDITVLDLGLQIAGPFASRLLADHGARVIKVSERNAIVGRRVMGNALGINRGKESIVLDLKREEGKAILMKLVARADVVHHNMRSGAFERLGLSFEKLKEVNPNIIYCHSSGYGNCGPWRNLPAWGPLLDAVTGMYMRAGGKGNAPMHNATHVDYGGALNAVPMILAALLVNRRGGASQQLEVPQLAASMFAMSDARIVDGEIHETFAVDGQQRGHAPTNALYQTANGCIVLSCYSQREWTGAHAALGLMPQETFAQARGHLPAWRDEQDGLGAAIAALRTEEIAERWAHAGVASQEPAVVAPEMLRTEEFERLNLIVRYHHARAGGDVFEIGHLVRFSDSTFSHTHPFPRLGENTIALLHEIGLSESEISLILEKGIAIQADFRNAT
jgi:predicted CxxxxCH...CXXCH cytochrome family protein